MFTNIILQELDKHKAMSHIFAFVDDDGTEKSAVYKWTGTWSDANGHVGNWVKVRNSIRQARNDLLDNITFMMLKNKKH